MKYFGHNNVQKWRKHKETDYVEHNNGETIREDDQQLVGQQYTELERADTRCQVLYASACALVYSDVCSNVIPL